MIRVKDAEKSLAFYQDVMGMSLIRTGGSKEAGFTLYFLAYPISYEIPSSSTWNYTAHREGLLELTWNHGTENDASFAYHSGNAAPQGFGHICKFRVVLVSIDVLEISSRLLTGVSVDDLDAACARLESKNVSWKKRLTDGRMKDIAFVLDPDGYWIEIIQNHKFKASI